MSVAALARKMSYMNDKTGGRVMAFEKFIKKGCTYKFPVLRISDSKHRDGMFEFNVGVRRIFGEGGATNAALLFDRETRRIGIHLQSTEGENTLKLTPSKDRNSGMFLSGKGFLQYFNIPERGRFKVEYDESEGLYVVDLKNGKIT